MDMNSNVDKNQRLRESFIYMLKYYNNHDFADPKSMKGIHCHLFSAVTIK